MSVTHTAETNSTHQTMSPEKAILLAVALFIAVVALATYIWGLPALAMIALSLVPVMYVVLILISVGK